MSMQEQICRTKQFIASPQLAWARTAPLAQQEFASLHKERYSMLKIGFKKKKKSIFKGI